MSVTIVVRRHSCLDDSHYNRFRSRSARASGIRFRSESGLRHPHRLRQRRADSRHSRTNNTNRKTASRRSLPIMRLRYSLLGGLTVLCHAVPINGYLSGLPIAVSPLCCFAAARTYCFRPCGVVLITCRQRRICARHRRAQSAGDPLTRRRLPMAVNAS